MRAKKPTQIKDAASRHSKPVMRSKNIVRRSRSNAPGAAHTQRPGIVHVSRGYESESYAWSGTPQSFKQYVARFFKWVPHFLANDKTAGLILIAAAAFAILWANSPMRETYFAISEYHVGPASLGLNMSIAHWAQDGLLTIFFFVVGLELKTEFVTGSLRDPREAALPMIAAVFGMAGPALIFTLIMLMSNHTEALHGWAIPTATDIAFAVAILQIFGKGLPPAARTFLLTLAVVDDLLGILVIALFYASDMHLMFLVGAFAAVIVFALLVQFRITKWWLLVPLGIIAWYCMYRSGVHATIAGVLLGMMVPAKRRRTEEQMTHRFTTLINPLSAGLAVPIFAFFAAGVNIVDTPGGAANMITHPVAMAVALALPFGKFIGIFGCVVIFTKLTPLRLGAGVDLADILPISFVAGIGFTVAMLISHLAFKGDELYTQAGSLGVVMGTLLSVILGSVLLQMRVKTSARGRVQ